MTSIDDGAQRLEPLNEESDSLAPKCPEGRARPSIHMMLPRQDSSANLKPPSMDLLKRRRSSKWGTAMRRLSIMSGASVGSNSSKDRKEPTPSEPIQKTLPPTYRLEPKPGEEFQWWKVSPVIQNLLSVYVADLEYSPKACARQCTMLADLVKNKVKGFPCQRHKIIVLVDIGENKQQDMALASRCVWDTSTDNVCVYKHVTPQLYVMVSVFAVYKE